MHYQWKVYRWQLANFEQVKKLLTDEFVNRRTSNYILKFSVWKIIPLKAYNIQKISSTFKYIEKNYNHLITYKKNSQNESRKKLKLYFSLFTSQCRKMVWHILKILQICEVKG